MRTGTATTGTDSPVTSIRRRQSTQAGQAPRSKAAAARRSSPVGWGRAPTQYSLAAPARASLKIYDVQGRMVRTLLDQEAAAGTFRALWDGRSGNGVAAGKGVYFARFVAGNQVVDVKKIVLE